MTKEIEQGGKVCDFAKATLKGEEIEVGVDKRVERLWDRLAPVIRKIHDEYQPLLLDDVVRTKSTPLRTFYYQGQPKYVGQHKKTGQVILVDWKTTAEEEIDKTKNRVQAAAYYKLVTESNKYKSSIPIDKTLTVIAREDHDILIDELKGD